jgi:hypothetical protein
VSEYQIAFMEALRGGRRMQQRMFDTIEQRHAHDFGNGRAGLKLYEALLSAVRESGVPEAAMEFEKRFFPLLNRERPRREADADPPEEMSDQDRMPVTANRWGAGSIWISTLCVAAVIFGVLILRFDVLKTTTAGSSTATKAPILDVKAIEPAPGAMADLPPETAIEAPSRPVAKGTETASEPVTESAPTKADEQKPSERQ